jgi:DNA-binding Xre family transcriptional regulator
LRIPYLGQSRVSSSTRRSTETQTPKVATRAESKEIRLAQKPIDTIVGARLSAIRIAQSVSTARLATVLGTTEHQIERYEDGTDRIPTTQLLQLCQYFSVNLADLFPRSDPTQDPNVH